jgi:hypothetical protein
VDLLVQFYRTITGEDLEVNFVPLAILVDFSQSKNQVRLFPCVCVQMCVHKDVSAQVCVFRCVGSEHVCAQACACSGHVFSGHVWHLLTHQHNVFTRSHTAHAHTNSHTETHTETKTNTDTHFDTHKLG